MKNTQFIKETLLVFVHVVILGCFLILVMSFVPSTARTVRMLAYVLLGLLFLGQVYPITHFKRSWIALSEKGKSIYLVLWTLFMCLLVLEASFSFYAKSHDVTSTLACEQWSNRYWKPINKLGFRDVDYPPQTMEKVKKVFVLGDSIVAGQGLKSIEDRFSNILSYKLPKWYRVINLGRKGVDPGKEYKILTHYPWKPDILILSYNIDDIIFRAEKRGERFPGYGVGDDSGTGFFVKKSYFANFLYWQLFEPDLDALRDYWKKAYSDYRVMDLHRKDLSLFFAFSREHSIPFIVVLFPSFIQEPNDQFHLAKMEPYFREKGAEVINVSKLTTGITHHKLVLHDKDSHPSGYLNKLIAEEIYRRINKNKWIDWRI